MHHASAGWKQPQLVLLQKTLLNIEGLGRQLDPELDLWQTAKPFLERWMSEQVGWRALRRQLEEEAPQWAKILPQLPRLVHRDLSERLAEREREKLRQRSARREAAGRRHERLLWVLLGVAAFAAGWWLKG